MITINHISIKYMFNSCSTFRMIIKILFTAMLTAAKQTENDRTTRARCDILYFLHRFVKLLLARYFSLNILVLCAFVLCEIAKTRRARTISKICLFFFSLSNNPRIRKTRILRCKTCGFGDI